MDLTLSNLILFLKKDLIVLAECCTEYYTGNALKAVDPLFTFRSLSSDVKHVNPRMFVSKYPHKSKAIANNN
jgi:hypothetical protein